MEKPTSKWLESAKRYRKFAEGAGDFSDSAASEMFVYESRGVGNPDASNGYYVGKLAQDRTIPMWAEDVRLGTLFFWELAEDFDEEWLKSVLPSGCWRANDNHRVLVGAHYAGK